MIVVSVLVTAGVPPETPGATGVLGVAEPRVWTQEAARSFKYLERAYEESVAAP